MACFHPIVAWRSKQGPSRETGKWPLVFNKNEGYFDKEVKLQCGKCDGCRMDRARDWSVRCLHEAKMYEENCFLTLTYSDDNLWRLQNDSGRLSLCKEDFVLFMKKLRNRNEEKKIRFFHCGEYGSDYGRPHHHVCLFNHDFADKKLFTIRMGNKLYTSESLREIWPYGYNIIGDITVESAAYIARYTNKKGGGHAFGDYFEGVDAGICPEYITMSRRPGIGKPFYEKFKTDIHVLDKIITKGLQCKPPKYYDKLYDLEEPTKMHKTKIERRIKCNKEEQEPDRLAVKEFLLKEKIKRKKRGYENGTSVFD